MDTILAAGAIYQAFQLEGAGLFDVAERIVESFQRGRLPIGGSDANRIVGDYDAERKVRMTKLDRASIYCRTFGFDCAADEPRPNRHFDSLWRRLLSAAVAAIEAPADLSREYVIRKAGRELGANLSLHGQGVALFAARDLQAHVAAAARLVSSSEILGAFGARDMWHVIDHVAATELGGSRNSARYRALAASGVKIIEWVADPPEGEPLPSPGRVTPTTRDLRDASEAWLSAATASDASPHGASCDGIATS